MKKREFYGHATLTDYLIAQGIGFHPDTVILQVDDIDEPKFPVPYTDALAGKVRPPFQYQIIEQILPYPSGDPLIGTVLLGRAIYVEYNTISQQLTLTLLNATDRIAAAGSYSMAAILTDDGYINQNAPGDYIDVDKIGPVIPQSIQRAFEVNDLNQDFIFALSVLYLINEAYDIEEVEFPRNYRRRVHQQTGKLPSNHYRVRRIKRTRKRYQSNGTGTGKKRPEHLVRGHFRHTENHPLAQFNGDWWIPAHYRGTDSDKSKSKPVYRIEL